MDFIGSKVKLNEWVFSIIDRNITDPTTHIFLDACCGSGVVSRYAAKRGYKVVSNDIMLFPKTIVNGSIGLSEEQKNNAKEWIERLNSLNGIEGYFYKHFSPQGKRKYFTKENAKIIDHIRNFLYLVKDEKLRDYLLYCGIESLSRVSNTAGVQAAYLKKFKNRANERIVMRMEENVDGIITVFCEDILKLLNKSDFRNDYKEDILYIDPPYNQRQYGPNYHLYETFVRNDNPIPNGKTGLRNWKEECHSEFCTKNGCLDFLKEIVELSVAKSIYLSYNSDGILEKDEVLKEFPGSIVHERSQKRYKSDADKNRQYNDEALCEYLFEIRH